MDRRQGTRRHPRRRAFAVWPRRHNKFYQHLHSFTHGFLIRDSGALVELAARYNERLTAAAARHPHRAAEFEAWENQELTHKVGESLERPPDPDFPPGHLLPRGDARTPGGFRPMAWNNPVRLADESQKAHDVLFVKDAVFRYAGGRYEPLHDTSLGKEVRGFIEPRANREFGRLSREWEADQAAGLKKLG